MPNPNFPLPKCPIHGRAIKRDSCGACNVAWQEDRRRVPAHTQFDATIGQCIRSALETDRTSHWARRRAA